MTHFDRVTQGPARLSGQPCIRGLELSVCQVIEELAARGSFQDVLRLHPELEEEDPFRGSAACQRRSGRSGRPALRPVGQAAFAVG